MKHRLGMGRKVWIRCKQCGGKAGKDSAIRSVDQCLRCAGKIKTAKASPFSNVRKGPALDLPKEYHKYFMRSGWERNFARVLVKQKIRWEFESDNCKFFFAGYRNAPRGYLCDFYVPAQDHYYEVKGFFRSQDRSKMKRLRKMYPTILQKLTVVLSKTNKKALAFYKEMGVGILFYEDLIESWRHKIPEWE